MIGRWRQPCRALGRCQGSFAQRCSGNISLHLIINSTTFHFLSSGRLGYQLLRIVHVIKQRARAQNLVMARKMPGRYVVVKLIVGAGQASPSPPVGPALGSKGVKSMDFCKVSRLHRSINRYLTLCTGVQCTNSSSDNGHTYACTSYGPT